MYTTYHLASAQEVSIDILEAIKANFKSKPITITVEEEDNHEISDVVKTVLDERLREDETDYITSKASIEQLQKKYGI